jgi:hypothetical protein
VFFVFLLPEHQTKSIIRFAFLAVSPELSINPESFPIMPSSLISQPVTVRKRERIYTNQRKESKDKKLLWLFFFKSPGLAFCFFTCTSVALHFTPVTGQRRRSKCGYQYRRLNLIVGYPSQVYVPHTENPAQKKQTKGISHLSVILGKGTH